MRHRLLATIITTIAISQGPALARVSDDLVFCSKLSSPKERIACYDAAARIAANAAAIQRGGPARTLVSAPAADTGGPPIYTPAAEKNRFQGGYAAIGGSYGFSSPRTVNLFGLGFGLPSDAVSAQGWSGHANIGYNVVGASNVLLGAEISGRFGHESASTSATSTASPLMFLQSGSAITRYEVVNDAGLHIAARAGLLFDQTLIFLRAGVGASHVRESGSFDARNSVTCTNFVNSACVTSIPGTLSSASRSRWIPSAIVGAGIEQNFGPAFVRAEAELEAVALQATSLQSVANTGATSEPYWFARVMASVGVRF